MKKEDITKLLKDNLKIRCSRCFSMGESSNTITITIEFDGEDICQDDFCID